MSDSTQGQGPATPADPTPPGRTTLEQLFSGGPSAPPTSPAPPAAPPPPPFIPTFYEGVAVENTQNGQSEPLNPMYFATEETALFLAETFGSGPSGVKRVNPFGSDSPYQANAPQWFFRTPRGQWLNAGLVAWTYTRMNNQEAAQDIRSQIQQAGG